MLWNVNRTLASLLVFASLATSPAQAADSPSRTDLKAGWTEAELTSFGVGCTEAIVGSARRDFAAAATKAGDTSNRSFPESKLRASVGPMCSCLALRVAATVPLGEVAQKGLDAAKPFVEEAMAGGQCKPEGYLGELLLRARK